MNIIKILIVVTSINTYESGNYPTGLWLSELTHLYHEAIEKGYEITIASPNGGDTPIDPESMKKYTLDKISRRYWDDVGFRAKLAHTESFVEIANESYDLVYLAGGHGTMYDFPDNTVLQQVIRKQYEANKLVGAICHGVGGLLNVKLSNGEYLIKGKKLTGYNWFEEGLARRKKEVPFNLERELKARGSKYSKAFIPMTSKVIVDGSLITGQNPFSSKQMAKVLMEELDKLTLK